ncbi:unnamed protein product [Ectocarpus sp. 13 AM-2016]
MFEAWDSQEKALAILGHRKWVEKAGSEIGRIDGLGKTLFSHLWQDRKERLAIGDRSCYNNAPSYRGRVVNGLTAKACKTSRVTPPPRLSCILLCWLSRHGWLFSLLLPYFFS